MRSPVVEIPWGCLFDPRRHHERNTYRCMFGHCSACDCECGALVANRLSLRLPSQVSGTAAHAGGIGRWRSGEVAGRLNTSDGRCTLSG